jgi:RNA polymerase sigma-70 factor, ECF subfamily
MKPLFPPSERVDKAFMSEDAPKNDEIGLQDAHWVTRALAGDQHAYRCLFEQYREQAYRVAYRLLGTTAEAADATQESFVKAFRSLERFERRSRFGTWLMRIVTNTCLDKLRGKAADPTISLSDELAAVMPQSAQPMRRDVRPADELEYEELRTALTEALRKLSPEHRTVFVLHTEEELKYREIAEVLGVSEGTVMSRLYHARRNLQRFLSQAGVLERVPRDAKPSPGGDHEA